MASFQKYKKNQYKYLLGHNERNFGARDGHIDYSLTHLNYNLAPGRYGEYFADRLQELNCSNRKDINAVAELIVSLPKTFTGNEKEFFSSVYDFCKKKYKEDNILGAYVHKDEPAAAPHIHVTFIPTYYDRQKKKVVVSYEKCVYNHLNKFHPDLNKYLTDKFGYEVGVINGATKDGNKTISQLKAESEIKSINDKLTRKNRVYMKYIQEHGLGEDFVKWRKDKYNSIIQKNNNKIVEIDDLQK